MKKHNTMNPIDDSNYELWLLRYAEDELSPAEREAVEHWLGSHPEAADELGLYLDAPRLEANEEVTFPHPERLERRSVPFFGGAWRWAAAAAVAAALVVPAVRLATAPESEEVRQVAQAEVPATAVAPAPDEEGAAPATAEANEALSVATRPIAHRTHQARAIQTQLENIALQAEAPADEVLPEAPEDAEEQPAWTADDEAPLFVYEEDAPDATASDDLVDNLIVYDSTRTLADLVLAANDAARESLALMPGGRYLHRLLPSSEALNSRVVEPAQRAAERGIGRTPRWVNAGVKAIETISNINK